MASVQDNLTKIQERMFAATRRAGREPDSVRLVAVTKRVPMERIHEAMDAGQHLFGENYLQEGREKIKALAGNAQWHFIGHLQTNKIKSAAELFDMVETIDSIKLAGHLEQSLSRQQKRMPVLVQVNIGRENQKSGVMPEKAEALIRGIRLFPHLEVRGLMAMPPFFADPEAVRPYFRSLRILGEELLTKGLFCHPGLELSMGMSNDFEVAIEEGATLIRVGTALFGERDIT